MNLFSDQLVKEKRLRVITLKTNSKKSHQRRSIETLTEFSVDTNVETDQDRSKRPGRLLPLQLLSYFKINSYNLLGLLILYSIDENSKKEEKHISKPFYGPPTNCIELGKLGYTLNGYYLVKDSNNGGQIEVILCRFQLPPFKNNESKKNKYNYKM